MSMFQKHYEHMGERFTAFVAALTAALDARVIKDDLEHITEQPVADLKKGIWTPLSDGESGYRNGPGMKAIEGRHRIVLVGHLAVNETDGSAAVRSKEFEMAEELKAFVRGGVPRMTINLESIRASRQLEHPYGWLYVELTLGPSDQGTH